MTSCDRYRRSLADVAAYAPALPGFEDHLAECESCRAAFANERLLVDRIEAELRAAVDVKPSPEFMPRARRRAVEKANARRPRLFQWLVPVGAGAALLAIGILAGRREPATPSEPPPLARQTAANTPGPPLPPEEPPSAAPARKAPRTALPVAKARPARPVEPEVLLAPGEGQAFLKFARDILARVDRQSLLAVKLDPEDLNKNIEVPAVEIKPVVIQPIPRSER
jgi:hypothetical protein